MAKLQACIKDLEPEKDWLYTDKQMWRQCVDKYGENYIILDNKMLEKDDAIFSELAKPDWFCDIEFTLDVFADPLNYQQNGDNVVFNRDAARQVLPESSDNLIESVCITAENLFPNVVTNPVFVKVITDEIYPDKEFEYLMLDNVRESMDVTLDEFNDVTCCMFEHGVCSKNELMLLKDWYEGNVVEITITNELDEELLDRIYPQCLVEGWIREEMLMEFLCRECGQPSIQVDLEVQDYNGNGELIVQDLDYEGAIKRAQESREDFLNLDRQKQSLWRYTNKKHYYRPQTMTKASRPTHKKNHEEIRR